MGEAEAVEGWLQADGVLPACAEPTPWTDLGWAAMILGWRDMHQRQTWPEYRGVEQSGSSRGS